MTFPIKNDPLSLESAFGDQKNMTNSLQLQDTHLTLMKFHPSIG